MNAAEAAVDALPSSAAAAVAGTGTRLYRIPIYVGCTLLVLAVNFFLGKDVPWDTLNYHLYAGFSAVHDRFALDYFPAGPQSYFNPYVYVPFYALVSSGLSSLQISSIEALVQSTILWLTYELAITTCCSLDARRRVTVGLCAMAFAYANPILIQQLGSSFADINTGLLVVGGWLLLARAIRQPRLSPVVWGGVIIGVAVALKPTNALHALAGAIVVLFVPLTLHRRVRLVLVYGLASLAGFVAVAAPWSYQLERMFGNPMFPLMNSLFRSPHFTTQPLVSYRFMPASLGEALWRPFAIVKPLFMTQEEIRAPDIRYALLIALAMAMLIWQMARIIQRAVRRRNGAATKPDAAVPAPRVLAAVGSGLFVDGVAWLAVSGNGRYFLPMACITAVVAMELLFRLLAARPKVIGYAVAAIFAVQGTQLALGGELRWDGQPWSEHWLDVEVPESLATQPNLYLDIGVQSNSFVLPFLAPGSGLINFSGSYALEPQGANGARIAALVRDYAPHVRVLTVGDHLYEDSAHSPRRSAVDADLAAFGLHVDSSDCQVVVANGVDDATQITRAEAADPMRRHRLPLLTCRLLPGGSIDTTWATHRRDADIALNRLEDACPRLFQPRRLQSQPFGDKGWMRYYTNTDELAWVSRGWIKFDDPVSGDGVAYLGRESDWLKGTQRVVCGRRDGHYYAKILSSK